jgi:hypothetical protein
MSILDKKQQIFGDIAAFRVLTEGLPKLKTSSSFPSINNGGNSITFLTDLIKSLIGYDALVSGIVTILSQSLPQIEREIKKALKLEIKNIVSCGVDPSLPLFIKSSGPGIIIEVSKVDFLDMLKVDPASVGGKLLYYGPTDFNEFLYNTIQNDGVMMTWAGIFDVTFNSLGSGTRPNNTFTIKANPAYNTKTLTDLNNDYVDSVSLFNNGGINVINHVIDIIFGSVSVSINKTTKQLEKEAQINNVIDCMVNADANETIDDNYFSFTNDEVYVHHQEADLRKKGIIKLQCCNKVAASVPVSFLTDFNNEMSGVTSTAQKTAVITSNLDKMATHNTINSTNPSDNISIKLNFVQQIINNIVKAIIGIILTPKVVMIFIINYRIIYGPSATFTDAIDFIRQNKNLIHNIMKDVSGMIIKLLISIALKEIAKLVTGAVAKKEIEKGKNQLSQLLSLIGVPQEAIRVIKGLV